MKRLHYTQQCHLRGRRHRWLSLPYRACRAAARPVTPSCRAGRHTVTSLRPRPALRTIGLVRGYRCAAYPRLATIKDATMWRHYFLLPTSYFLLFQCSPYWLTRILLPT